MKVIVLTSSRADYGIYLPLLKKLDDDPFFDLSIIAFGTHLSETFGYTYKQIKSDGFKVLSSIKPEKSGDDPVDISKDMAYTLNETAKIWMRSIDEIDLVFALGDRYEMFAAVASTLPFNLKIAHIHGGETTLGAIDNKFRHCITLMSSIHFTSTQLYADKVKNLTGSDENVYNVGALSLDNLSELKMLSIIEFKSKFNIDLSNSSILTTIHPETVELDKNEIMIKEVFKVFKQLLNEYQIIITLPNADTMGLILRKYMIQFANENKNVFIIENFGTLAYFSCMKYCSFLLGNTSSGIIEAASFGKYVINLGNRQKGRACSENVIQVEDVNEKNIMKAIIKIKEENRSTFHNIYQNENSASYQIIKILKKIS